MENEDFEIISTIAISQFDEDYFGLQFFLNSGNNMKKYFEQNYRIADYKKTGYLPISQNERNFHLIGFIDALAWLNSQGFINLPPEDDNSEEEPLAQEIWAAGVTASELVRHILKID